MNFHVEGQWTADFYLLGYGNETAVGCPTPRGASTDGWGWMWISDQNAECYETGNANGMIGTLTKPYTCTGSYNQYGAYSGFGCDSVYSGMLACSASRGLLCYCNAATYDCTVKAGAPCNIDGDCQTGLVCTNSVCATASQSCSPAAGSDWTISAPAACDGVTKLVDGKITIQTGGRLDLTNNAKIASTGDLEMTGSGDRVYIYSGKLCPGKGGLECVFGYKKPITVSNSGSAQTDYQVAVFNPVYDESNLVGSWHFSEGTGTRAADSSSSLSYDGTISGASWTTAGKFGNALSFNGTSSYVQTVAFEKRSLQKTVCAWVKPTNQSGLKGLVIHEGAFYLRLNNMKLEARVYNNAGATSNTYDSVSSLTADQWSFVCEVIDSSSGGAINLKYYINGNTTPDLNQDTDVSGLYIGTAGTNYLKIGNDDDTTGRFFSGLIDEVRVYERALTGAETAALYNAKVRLDYTDIRFADTDGSALSHWMENDGKFWVKIPSVPAGDKTIYVYYGNAGIASGSNGTNTFAFFDDFSGSSLDTNKWQKFNGGTPAFANGELTISTNNVDPGKLIAITAPTSDYYVLRSRFKVTGGTNVDERAGLSIKTGTSDGRGYNYILRDFTNLDERSFLNDAVAWDVRAGSWSKNVWYLVEIYHDGTNVKGSFDSGSWQSVAWSGRTGYPALTFGSYDSATTTVWDFAAVRKYAAAPPSSSVGSEQAITPP